ncbi:MAG: MoxR-like ATPase [Archaeoglobaceae archaeon]|nr:MoxR-like ATPase [Archaeoglobaceae archaeon]
MRGDEFFEKLKKEVGKVIVGKEDVIELLTVAMLSNGHVILEGVPGVAKTTIAKSFAKAIGLSFARIQLTPDMMPADIVGSSYFDMKSSEFKIRKGPIFANVVLADEINRAMPKTQSALLEAMQERQVTIEGTTFKLPEPFIVIATMNPIEHESVYRLPEAQLDRFMVKIDVEYPERDEEIEMLERKSRNYFNDVETIFDKEEVLEMMKNAASVKVSRKILEYIREIAFKTRIDERVLLGASPRASEHLLFASKSLAFLKGRDYVIPDDVKALSVPVLAHRIKIKPEYEIDGFKAKDLVKEVVNETEVPK